MDRKIFFKRMKLYGISFCISYTMVSAILSFLNLNSELISGNIWLSNVQILVVCFVIAVLMLITDTIRSPETIESQLTPGFFALELLDVAVPVIGLGGFAFKWFDVFSLQVLYPICILVAVYFAVFAMFYINSKHTEKELNRKISKRKEELKNGRQDN